MSNGRTHATVASATLIATCLAAPYIASHAGIEIAVGLVAGALAGVLVTPDIDLEDCRTWDEQRIFRLFGNTAGRFWQWFWMGYARHHSHRGSSHRPLVGTIGRWWHIWTHTLFLPVLAVLVFPQVAIAAFAANCLQDILHLIFDGWHYHREG